MEKKTLMIGIGIIVIVGIAVAAVLALRHMPTTTSSTTSSNSSTAVNNAVLKTKTSSKSGQYLTDAQGNTLYTYNQDTAGVSKCVAACLADWPAYVDTGATTGLPAQVSTIMRTDNSKTQFTYKGMPLYTFVSDTPGEATGDGVDNFALARP